MEKLYSVHVSHHVFESSELFHVSDCVCVQRLPLKAAVSFAARLFEAAYCNVYVLDDEKSDVVAYMVHFDKNPF